ncbi:class I SAM-dependent methyltransferase [Terracidiphilus gabretensis]|uniref:class I SAM-dependent methyltransferase n=1 Tax=Terracidiphilus gabretensis TaxID=1577687 RepID=UPI00071B222F|nr:class I SAM-dependent methyltransferase [Terracidiphilus gabretensis]
MSQPAPTTSETNGRYWGTSADDWATIQEQTCKPVYEAALARLNVDHGTCLLDAGCGAGLAAQMASLRGAQVAGIDAAEKLLAIARTRVPSGDFRLGELEQLPFEEDAFDVVTGFNSFQYAASAVTALTEACRVTRPGGSVLIMTWGKPEGMQAASLVTALRPLLPPPPPGAPGPFALSDEAALRALAASAGLEPTEVFDVDCPWHYANLDEALRGLRSSGVAARVIEGSGIEAVNSAHAAALTPFLQSDGSYRVGATFRCLIART